MHTVCDHGQSQSQEKILSQSVDTGTVKSYGNLLSKIYKHIQCNQAGSTNQIGQFSLNPSSPLPNLQAQQSSLSPVVTSNCPFEVKFLTPAIKICAGCRKGYARAPDEKGCLPPPNDLCLVHKEQHLYYNIVNGRQQLSSLSNVHYHANVTCPKSRFPSFDPHAVQVPDEIKPKLLEVHKVFLHKTFGIG